MNKLYSKQNTCTYVPLPYRMFSFLVVIMMLGNVYLFPFFKSLDMGEVLFILFVPYFFVKINKVTINKEYNLMYVFVLYSAFVTMIMCIILNGDIVSPLVRMIRDFFYYFIIFFLGFHFFDMKSFKKILVCFCVILSGFVVIQVLVYTLNGYFIPGFLMKAPLNDGGYTGAELYAHYVRYASIAGYLKPNGFLCEPAHCAQCFFVAILVLLFDKHQEKNDVKTALFISVGTVLTMSTSAMLYLAFAWTLWCFKEAKKDFSKIFFIIVLAIAVGIIAIKNGKFDKIIIVIERFTKTITGNRVTNSSQLRMMKGFYTFLAFPLLEKLFGIGFGNYSAALSSILSNVKINMIENEYMNTVSYILVSSGIVGFSIFSSFFIGVYRRSCALSKIMIVALIMMSLGSSIYSSTIWIWMMLLILYSGREGCQHNGRCFDSELQ